MSEGTIVQIAPSQLNVAANVRTDTKVTKEFVDGIRLHGVLVPITVVSVDGRYDVIDGQRRTLAAVEAGLGMVPAYVTQPMSDDGQRIVQQLVVNEARSELWDKEAAAAVTALELFGMTVPAIAEQTGFKQDFVSKSVAVGKSKVATKALGKLDLDVAMILADFDEFPAEQKKLLEEANKGWSITHSAQQFRDARALAAIAEEIAAMDGVELIKDPGWNQSDPLPVDRLYLDAKWSKRADDLTHAKLVAQAGDGLCAYPSLQYVGQGNARKVVVAYAVRGWAARGFFAHIYGSDKPAKPEDPEKLKQERRIARENTKAWVAATAVRREFLVGALQRKVLPKGWEQLIVRRMLDNESHGSYEWRTAIALLGLKESADSYSLRGVVSDYAEKNPTVVLRAALGTWAGSIEGGFEFERKGWSQSKAIEYLQQLQSWGYELAPIEQLVIAKKTAKGVQS